MEFGWSDTNVPSLSVPVLRIVEEGRGVWLPCQGPIE